MFLWCWCALPQSCIYLRESNSFLAYENTHHTHCHCWQEGILGGGERVRKLKGSEKEVTFISFQADEIGDDTLLDPLAEPQTVECDASLKIGSSCRPCPKIKKLTATIKGLSLNSSEDHMKVSSLPFFFFFFLKKLQLTMRSLLKEWRKGLSMRM